MANKVDLDAMKALADDIKAENESKGMDEINSFGGNAEGAISRDDSDKKRRDKEKEARVALVNNAITANTKGVKLSKTALVEQFNRKYGEVIGYVVTNDAKVEVAYKTNYVLDENKHRVLDPKAKADPKIVAAFNAGEKIAPKNYLSNKSLEVREKAPSKHIGVILSVPVGGQFTSSELREGKELQPNLDRTDCKIVTLPTDIAAGRIIDLFGGSINECKATHGKLGSTLTVTMQMSVAKAKDASTASAATQKAKVKYKFKSDSRSRIVIPGNYVPRKVFVGEHLSAIVAGGKEVQDKYNKDLFYNVFKVSNDTSKYQQLDEASKELISKDGDTYSSKYLVAGGKPLDVRAFWDKEETISDPVIPEKTYSSKGAAKNVVFDVLNPDEKYAAFDPENDKRFAALKEALGGVSFKEVVSQVAVKTKKNTNSTRRDLDNEQSRQLLASLAENGSLTNVETDFNIGISEINKADEIAASLRFSDQAR